MDGCPDNCRCNAYVGVPLPGDISRTKCSKELEMDLVPAYLQEKRLILFERFSALSLPTYVLSFCRVTPTTAQSDRGCYTS